MKIKFLTFFIFFFISSALFSEENLLFFNLEKALEVGIKNSPELAQMEKDLKKAELDISINQAAFYPTLFLGGGYNLSESRHSPGWNPDYHRATAEIDWTLYDYGRRFLHLKTVKSKKRSLKENYRRAYQNKSLEITSAYLSVLKGKELVNLSKKRLERAERYYGLTETKLKVGLVSYADLLKSKVEVKSAESGLISDLNNLSLSKIKLTNLLGLEKEVDYHLDPEIKISFPFLPLEKSLSEALNKRPEIKEEEEKKIQADYAYRLVRKDYLPSCSLKGNYDYYLNRDLSGYPDTTNWTFFLTVEVPIFDAGIRRSRLKQAELNKEKLNFSEERLIRDITEDVSSAFFNLQNSEKLKEVQEERVTAANESLRLATARYEEGISSILEVIDAQTDLVSAETDRINTLFNYQLAKANLIVSIGKNIEDYLSR